MIKEKKKNLLSKKLSENQQSGVSFVLDQDSEEDEQNVIISNVESCTQV